MTPQVYLDYNATAPLRPEAAAAMAEAFATTGNPSSVHGFGRAARRRIEEARETLAGLVGAEPAELVFTSGGTEANNLALAGSGRRRLLVSAGEHDSVLKAAPRAERLPLDAEGRLRPAALEAALAASDEPALVSVMLANNETGVIQPLAEVAAIARAHGALVHCDTVQALGKIPLDVAALGAQLVSLSAHKLGGPAGIGALVVRDGLETVPLLVGGGQERRRRAGTENLAGIVGFAAAAAAAVEDLADQARIRTLRDAMERAVRGIAPDLEVHGAGAERLANTSCLGLPGVPAETQVMALDLAGIAVSAGSACSSGKVEPSHVLRAMGLEAAVAGRAIRVSLGWASREADISLFVEAWRGLYERRHPRCLAMSARS